MKNRLLKFVMGCFLVVLSFFVNSVVFAKILTIEEVNDEFNTIFIDEINEFVSSESSLYSKIDSENYVLEVYQKNGDKEDEKIFSINYSNDYVEYTNSAELTKEYIIDNDDKELSSMLCVNALMQTIIKLSGYDNKTIKDDDYTNTYDEYGLLIESEDYEYSDETGDVSVLYSGDFIKNFMMSLDTDKIKALIEKYGEDLSDNNNSVLNTIVPTLVAKDITENSITLYPSVSYIDTDDDVLCYVYRSNSRDGNYEKISNVAVNCSGDVSVTDSNLSSNTTYYYKAIVVGSDNYSDVLEVKTVAHASTTNNDTIENPKTGTFIPFVIIIILTILSFCGVLYVQKFKCCKNQ